MSVKGRIKVEVFLVPDEMEILKDLSEKDDVSYSEYMRLAFLSDAVFRGNQKAIKLTAKRMAQKLQAKWSAYVKAQGKEEVEF